MAVFVPTSAVSHPFGRRASSTVLIAVSDRSNRKGHDDGGCGTFLIFSSLMRSLFDTANALNVTQQVNKNQTKTKQTKQSARRTQAACQQPPTSRRRSHSVRCRRRRARRAASALRHTARTPVPIASSILFRHVWVVCWMQRTQHGSIRLMTAP